MRRTLLAAVLAVLPAAAFAHHPGAQLDEVMAGQEPAFEAIDRAAPDFALADAAGAPVALSDLSDKVVVLAFAPDPCEGDCAVQMAKLADIQGKIDVGGMGGMVRFLAVTDAASAAGLGAAQGLDPAGWSVLAAPDGAVEAAYAGTLGRDEAPVAYVIDRGGRLAGAFHGTGFAPVNMVLYINGLTTGDGAPEEQGWWDEIRDLF